MSDPPEQLTSFKPLHSFFVGIDSDGCVFDTMEIKQKECFAPNTVKFWGLQSVAEYVWEATEFVNLYSRDRGTNRWPALVKVLDLLAERPEVRARNARLPDLKPLRDFVASGLPLDNQNLKALADKTGEPVLKLALEWSEAVNRTVAQVAQNVPLFPYVRESLARLQECADVMVVSQTPTEALKREWREHGLDQYVRLICGQELGTKVEHIQFATRGRYGAEKTLMVGDAPADLEAARAGKARFFPINPGEEDRSWKRFHEEGIDRFLAGRYTADFEQTLIDEFQAHLPELPPWKR